MAAGFPQSEYRDKDRDGQVGREGGKTQDRNCSLLNSLILEMTFYHFRHILFARSDCLYHIQGEKIKLHILKEGRSESLWTSL